MDFPDGFMQELQYVLEWAKTGKRPPLLDKALDMAGQAIDMAGGAVGQAIDAAGGAVGQASILAGDALSQTIDQAINVLRRLQDGEDIERVRETIRKVLKALQEEEK